MEKEKLKQLLIDFSSYLSSEWHCPDIDEDIIDEFLDDIDIS